LRVQKLEDLGERGIAPVSVNCWGFERLQYPRSHFTRIFVIRWRERGILECLGKPLDHINVMR
jgi:hypothetical protein